MRNRIIVTVLILAAVLTSCQKRPNLVGLNGYIQGTTYNITYDNNGNFDTREMSLKIEKILHDFDLSLSLYNDSSILCMMNRNEDVVADSFFIDVFQESDSISKLTNGAFDVTVGPLVRAWGFGPDENKNFDEKKLDSLLNLVGMEKVSLVNGRLIKQNPAIQLDFNAIAQGYSVDVICDYFNSLGIKNYLVEIGGEVRANGTKGGALWRIGIDKPEDYNMSPGQDLQAIIRITDESVATSGNYRKFYVENGVKYSHTINPKTGYPAKNTLLSATIIAGKCGIADGIATACMVMGKDGAIALLKRNPHLSGYLIYSDDSGNYKTWMSESLEKNISETGK